MPKNQKLTSSKLKSLEQSDVLPIKDRNNDYLVVTKIEIQRTIREFIIDEFDFLADKIATQNRELLEAKINKQMKRVDEVIGAYIDTRFDQLSEKLCELLLNRKFNEEVERKVKERLSKRGKF